MDVCVLTGADSDGGVSLARLLVERGFRVYGLVEEQKNWGFEHSDFIPLEYKGEDRQQLEAMMRAVLEHEKGIFAVVHLARSFSAQSFRDLDTDRIESLVFRNLTLPLIVNKVLLPGVIQEHGHLVQCCCPVGKGPRVGGTLYLSLEDGLQRFYRRLYEEVRSQGIRVSCLRPFGVLGATTHDQEPGQTITGEFLAASIMRVLTHGEGSFFSDLEIRPEPPVKVGDRVRQIQPINLEAMRLPPPLDKETNKKSFILPARKSMAPKKKLEWADRPIDYGPAPEVDDEEDWLDEEDLGKEKASPSVRRDSRERSESRERKEQHHQERRHERQSDRQGNRSERTDRGDRPVREDVAREERQSGPRDRDENREAHAPQPRPDSGRSDVPGSHAEGEEADNERKRRRRRRRRGKNRGDREGVPGEKPHTDAQQVEKETTEISPKPSGIEEKKPEQSTPPRKEGVAESQVKSQEARSAQSDQAKREPEAQTSERKEASGSVAATVPASTDRSASPAPKKQRRNVGRKRVGPAPVEPRAAVTSSGSGVLPAQVKQEEKGEQRILEKKEPVSASKAPVAPKPSVDEPKTPVVAVESKPVAAEAVPAKEAAVEVKPVANKPQSKQSESAVTEEKPARKAAAKKTTTRKTAAKKTTTKKAVTKKVAAPKEVAKKATAKKVARKSAAKKTESNSQESSVKSDVAKTVE